jgi:hypothetical protein
MKQQQAQLAWEAPASNEFEIEAAAIRNFKEKNVRGDRAWSQDRMDPSRPALVLSERERLEFIEQARHEIELKTQGPKLQPSLH